MAGIRRYFSDKLIHNMRSRENACRCACLDNHIGYRYTVDHWKIGKHIALEFKRLIDRALLPEQPEAVATVVIEYPGKK